MDVTPQPTARDEGENVAIAMQNAPSESADGQENKAPFACDRCKKHVPLTPFPPENSVN
jgi:hypothetical protein